MFLVDALNGAFGVHLQLGLWAGLLLAAYQLVRVRSVFGTVSKAYSMVIAVLVAFAVGLATGVIPTIDVGRLADLFWLGWDVGRTVLGELADIALGGGS